MPKLKAKQQQKRRFARVWGNLDRTIGMLAAAYSDFQLAHADLAQLIEIMAKQLLIVQAEVEDFWRSCWGELPEDMSSWE